MEHPALTERNYVFTLVSPTIHIVATDHSVAELLLQTPTPPKKQRTSISVAELNIICYFKLKNIMPLRERTNLIDESFFFVTTTVVDFQKFFNNKKCCDALISNIKHYQKKYNFEILAYVIMPSHSCLAGL